MKKITVGLLFTVWVGWAQNTCNLLSNGWLGCTTLPSVCQSGISPSVYLYTNSLLYTCLGNTYVTPSGSGTVTSFSAGTLSPLFTTSVSNPTTTPALGFSLDTFSADNIFGNFTGATAAPSTQAIPACANDGAHALVYVSHVLTCEALTAGTGTVTSITSGNLSPLFTVSIANPTTTPAFTFTLSNFSADNIYGNFTGSTAAPSTQAIPACAADGSHALTYPSHTLTCTAVSGGGSGTINAANQYSTPYYSAAGSATTISGAAVTGIPYVNGAAPVAAVAANVYGLWSGTCSSSTYLRGDGSCQTPSGGGNVSTTGSPTTNVLPKFASATTIGNSTVTDNGTTVSTTEPFAATSVSTGTSPPTCTPGTAGADCYGEGTVPSAGPASGVDVLYASSVLHGFLVNFNNGGYVPLTTGPTSVTSGHIATWTSEGVLADGGAAPTTPTAHTISVNLTCTGSGSASAQSCTTSPTFVPASGDSILFTTSVTNTGGLTLNVNSSGAANVYHYAAALEGCEIRSSTVPTLLVFDGTEWNMQAVPVLISTGLTGASGAGSLNNLGSISSASNATLTIANSCFVATDTPIVVPNASLVAVTGFVPATTGGVTVQPYMTTGNINFAVSNWSTGALTVGTGARMAYTVYR